MKPSFTFFKGVQSILYKSISLLLIFVVINYQQVNAQCSCTGSSGNLLLNPSFETSGGNSSTANWTFNAAGGNSSFSSTTGYEVCGSRYGLITNGGTVYQEVTGIPVGTLITWNIWAGVHTAGLSQSPTLRLRFYNASNVEISGTAVTVAVDRDVDNYNGTPLLKHYTLSRTVPTGATKVRVQGSVNGDYLKLDGGCLSYNNLTLGNKVFFDKNNNGLFDATEHGMDGFVVNLYVDANDDNVADGGAIQTTITANGGTYTFTNLSAGNYIVGVENAVSGLVSSTNIGSSSNVDNNTDNDDNGISTTAIITGTETKGNAITLTPNQEPGSSNVNNTYDFGFTCSGGSTTCGRVNLSQGNFVWRDLNGNGVKDGNEVGVANVTVKLYRDLNNDNIPDFTGTVKDNEPVPLENLTAIQTTTTNSQGQYSFTTNVDEGRYIVGITLPAGFVRVPINSATPDNDIDNDNNGINQTGLDVFSNGFTLNYYMEPPPTTDGDHTNANATIDFAISLTGGSTPINFTSLEGVYKNGMSNLTWATLQESNSSHFDVERSIDGFTYNVIGKVNAGGNTYSRVNYAFNDAKPNPGTNYYRLRMIDKDGTYDYSNVVSIKITVKGVVITTVYPNPFINSVSATISSDKQANATISLYDFAGRIVLSQQRSINKGISTLKIESLTNLPKGYYTLKIQTDESQIIQKLLK
jgi:hypothetical protein